MSRGRVFCVKVRVKNVLHCLTVGYTFVYTALLRITATWVSPLTGGAPVRWFVINLCNVSQCVEVSQLGFITLFLYTYHSPRTPENPREILREIDMSGSSTHLLPRSR